MPFYDLFCQSCDKEYNIMATMANKENRNIQCPDCGTTDLKTVYNSAPNFIKKIGDSGPACPNRSVCGSGGCARA